MRGPFGSFCFGAEIVSSHSVQIISQIQDASYANDEQPFGCWVERYSAGYVANTNSTSNIRIRESSSKHSNSSFQVRAYFTGKTRVVKLGIKGKPPDVGG